MAVFTIQAPDGRKIRIRADNQETAIQGAQEWAAENPKAGRGNVDTPTPEFNGALADASERSQFAGYQPKVYGEANSDLPVPRPGVSGPSRNIQTTGMMENIGAGVDSGANAILGAPVDLPVFVGNSVINAGNSAVEMAGGGRPIPNIPNDLPGSSQGWERTQQGLGFTPPSAVTPGDSGQALARGAAEATAMATIPEVAMMKAGQVFASATPAAQAGIDMLSSLFGQSRNATQFGKSMAVNAAAGGGAEAAMNAAPDGWEGAAGLAGGLTAATAAHGLTELPSAIQSAFKVLGDYLAPLSKGGQERAAGTILRESATSPGDVIDAIDNAPAELVLGSRPTTFQQTGDMGLGGLERSAAAKSPGEFMQRRADQNTARVSALENVQPTGAPEQVVASMRSYMDDIDKASQATIDAATAASAERVNSLSVMADQTTGNALTGAQTATGALGAGVRPEAAGTALREALETARAQAKTQERALWQAVDPDGTLTLGAQNTRTGAAQTRREMPASAKPMSGEEAAIFETAAQYADDVPFSELTALQSRLKSELRAERIANGESPAYLRLSILNSSIQKDLEAAIVGKVRQEAEAVAAGTMRAEDTAAAALQREVDAWRQSQRSQQSGQSVVGLDGNAGAARASNVSSAPRKTGEISGRPVSTPGNPRLPQNAGAAADAGAVERLNAARSATKQRADTFDNKTLGPIRKRPATNAPYDDPAASVPSRIFFPGAKSPEAITKLVNAVGQQQAMPVLRDYAVDRLRKAALRPDGTIDPAKASAWMRQHDDALRDFPDLAAAIKRAMGASDTAAATALEQRRLVKAAETAEARQITEKVKAEKARMDVLQAGIVGRLLGLNDPQDISRVIGSVFSRQDSVKQMARIKQALGSNENALEGLRKAVVDFMIDKFVSNTEAATSRTGVMKSDQLQSFVAQHKKALEMAGFSDHELRMMDDLAEDLQRANRSLASVKLPGGSNTAQDLIATNAADGKASWLTKLAIASASGGGTSLFLGPFVGVPVAAATVILGQIRQNGIETIDDLVRDAMLNPARARALMIKAAPSQAKQKGLDLGQAYRRAALTSAAMADRDPPDVPIIKKAPIGGSNGVGQNALSALGGAFQPTGNALSSMAAGAY